MQFTSMWQSGVTAAVRTPGADKIQLHCESARSANCDSTTSKLNPKTTEPLFLGI
jgi:hypothetical protein